MGMKGQNSGAAQGALVPGVVGGRCAANAHFNALMAPLSVLLLLLGFKKEDGNEVEEGV